MRDLLKEPRLKRLTIDVKHPTVRIDNPLPQGVLFGRNAAVGFGQSFGLAYVNRIARHPPRQRTAV